LILPQRDSRNSPDEIAAASHRVNISRGRDFGLAILERRYIIVSLIAAKTIRNTDMKGTEDEKEFFKATITCVRLVGHGGLRWLQGKRPNGESRQSGG
jgi:hypothetical protein